MDNDADHLKAAQAYVSFLEEISPVTLPRLKDLCTPDVRFRDPFNDVTGIASYQAVLEKMFRDVEKPRLEVAHWAMSGHIAYLRWDFTFTTLKGRNNWFVEGMSEVHFDSEARVAAHLDHWDSGEQLYARLPIVRHIIHFVRNRVSAEP